MCARCGKTQRSQPGLVRSDMGLAGNRLIHSLQDSRQMKTTGIIGLIETSFFVRVRVFLLGECLTPLRRKFQPFLHLPEQLIYPSTLLHQGYRSESAQAAPVIENGTKTIFLSADPSGKLRGTIQFFVSVGRYRKSNSFKKCALPSSSYGTFESARSPARLVIITGSKTIELGAMPGKRPFPPD